MPNVTLAARTAAESTFAIVTDASRVITHGTGALANLALTGAKYAEVYRQESEKALVLGEKTRTKRLIDNIVRSDLEYEDDLNRFLANDKAKIARYNDLFAEYSASIA